MRYRLYGEWEKDDEQIPMVLSARQTAKVSDIFCIFEFVCLVAILSVFPSDYNFLVHAPS